MTDLPARFALLDYNATALAARIELCALARRSIDLQCYIFRDDDSGRLLTDALVEASERGVIVRLLLDDLDASGRESALGRMAAHPGFEVRLFNPFKWRGWLRPLAWLQDPDRLGRRMHAKALVIDDTHAIIGGRNVGDEYFAPEAELAFADIDVLVEGPLVAAVGESFERHWRSAWAVPLERLRARRVPLEVARRTRRRLAGIPPRHDPVMAVAASSRAEALIRRLRIGIWPDLTGRGRLFADRPEKLEAGDDASGHFETPLRYMVAAARREILIMTPYLVPGPDVLASIRGLCERGVRVRILTNSLAATDAVAVHAGYRRYRRALLELGVDLYEYRPTGFWGRRLRRMIRGAYLRASLHVKTIVVDDELVMIGSANLDPRSDRLNLELGVLIECAALVSEIRTCFEEAIRPVNAWRLRLEDDRVTWEGVVGATTEPEAGWGRRLAVRLLAFLPLESQL